MRKGIFKSIIIFMLTLVTVFCLSSCGEESLLDDYKDLNNSSRKLITISDSVRTQEIKNQFDKANFLNTISMQDAHDKLKSGEADALVYSTHILKYMQECYKGLKVVDNSEFDYQNLVIAVNGNDDSLYSDLQSFVSSNDANGNFQKLYDQYFLLKEPSASFDSETENSISTIKVAVQIAENPQGYTLDNNYYGYDIDVANALSQSLDKDLVLVSGTYEQNMAKLENGEVDIMLGAYSKDFEGYQNIRTTTTYLDTGLSVLMCYDKLKPSSVRQVRYSSLSEVDGKTVGTVIGSSLDDLAKEKLPNSKFKNINDYSVIIEELKSNRIEGYLLDEAIAVAVEKNHKELSYFETDIDKVSTAFARTKNPTSDQQEKFDNLDEFISELKSNGELERLAHKWIYNGAGADDIEDYRNLKAINGKLTATLFAISEPFSYIANNRLIGYEVELLTLFCKKHGYALDITRVTNFSTLLASVENSDLIGGNLTVTDERREQYNFTPATYNAGIVFVTHNDVVSIPKYSSVDQLEGKNIAFIEGSGLIDIIDKNIINLNAKTYNNITDQGIAVLNGDAEAVITDLPVALALVGATEGLTLIDEVIIDDRYGYAMEKGNPIVQEINTIIAKYREDGTLDKLEEKWIKNAGTIIDADYTVNNPKTTLVYGCMADNPPMSFMAHNKIVGYDVELMYMICHELGYNLQIETTKFSSLLSGVGTVYDIIGSGISITDERKEVYDFTEPNYIGGSYAVVKDLYEDKEQFSFSAFFGDIKDSFNRTFIEEDRWVLILNGILTTVIISIGAGILGTILGFLICLLRMSKVKFLKRFAKVYISILQGTPMVVFLMIIYYIVLGGLNLSSVFVSIVAFSLSFSAYTSEMMRTGIEAVDKGQIEAGRALGFSKVQVFIKIILPQSAKHFLPVFRGEFISTVKMTSVVGYIGVEDLTKMSDIIRSRTFEAFFPLISTAVLYFIIAFLLASVITKIEKSIQIKRGKTKIKGVEVHD